MKKYKISFLSTLIILSSINYQAFSKEKTFTIDNNSLYPEKSMKRDAFDAFESKNYSKAKLLYEKLYKKFPNNEYYLFSLANSMFILKDYKNAYDKYSLLINMSENQEYVIESNKKIKEILKIIKLNKNNPKATNLTKKNIIIQEEPENNYLCNKSDPTIFTDNMNETFRKWEKEDLPLKIYIPKIPTSYQIEDQNKYTEWFKKSIQRWTESIPNFISYIFVDNESNANVIINWSNYFQDESWGLAQMPHIDSEKNKRISNINLAVRAKLSNGEFLFSESEFVQIVTHELGHTFGLAHSYRQQGNDDIMFPTYRSRIPGNEPNITQRDINSLKKLYSLSRNNNYICK